MHAFLGFIRVSRSRTDLGCGPCMHSDKIGYDASIVAVGCGWALMLYTPSRVHNKKKHMAMLEGPCYID